MTPDEQGERLSLAGDTVGLLAAGPSPAGDGQLTLDFSASAADRQRRARKAAASKAANDQPALFTNWSLWVPNIDVHLQSAATAHATISGPDPERAVTWLSGMVGATQLVNGPRRVAFPADRLDRLMMVRPPANVTLDGPASAVAKAVWAAALQLKPLRVSRHRTRIRAASPRGWPAWLKVVDAPWLTVAALIRAGVPVEVDDKAKDLLATRLEKAEQPLATASLAGTSIRLTAPVPALLEALKLPALAHLDPSEGTYQMPILAAAPLLREPRVIVSDAAAAAIERATRPIDPLKIPPTEEFPWTLFPFQERDAAAGLRIVETIGGALLAGDMGSGKAHPVDTPVVTPDGWRPIGDLAPGDLVAGVDGRFHRVSAVYPQGMQEVWRVVLSDGSHVHASAEHLWTLVDQDIAVETTVTTSALMEVCASGRWCLPAVQPVQFPPPAVPDQDPRQVAATVTALTRSGLKGPDRAHQWDRVRAWATGSLATREAVVAGFVAAGRVERDRVLVDLPAPAADLAAEVTRSLGGWAQVVRLPGFSATVHPGAAARVHLVLPAQLARPVRLFPGCGAVPQAHPPARSVQAVIADGSAETVCISVDSPGSLYLVRHYIPSHNTTVSLAMTHHLQAWPLLVVAPVIAFSTWERQLGEMNKTAYLATDTLAKSWDIISEGISSGTLDAVVIAYDRLHQFVDLIEQLHFAAVIADEAQRIRTPGSRRSRALRALAAAIPIRIALSGTPLVNSIADVLPIGAVVAPGEWRPRAREKDLQDMYPGDPIQAVTDHLGSLMVRRTMADTGVVLPDRHDHRVQVLLHPEQRRELELLQEQAEQERESGELEAGGRLHAFVKLQRMRAVVNDPVSYGLRCPNPKVTYALDLVERFLAEGRKGVVFCADRPVFTQLSEAMTKAGIKHVGIWGSTPPVERIALEKQFHNDPETKVVVATIQAASESVSFSPTGTFLIALAYPWAPAARAQMQARIRRMNQTEPVDIIQLHASAPSGTLDDRMLEVLTLKEELAAQVVDRTSYADPSRVHYSLADLVFLLTGSRDEALDHLTADQQRVVQAEQDRKEHARRTLHGHKKANRSDGSLVRDDGQMARTIEQYAAAEGLDLAEVEVDGIDGDDLAEFIFTHADDE